VDDTERFFGQMDVLLKCDVFPPGAIHLFYKLLESGYYQGKLPLTLDEAAARLRALMDNGRKQ